MLKIVGPTVIQRDTSMTEQKVHCGIKEGMMADVGRRREKDKWNEKNWRRSIRLATPNGLSRDKKKEVFYVFHSFV